MVREVRTVPVTQSDQPDLPRQGALAIPPQFNERRAALHELAERYHKASRTERSAR